MAALSNASTPDFWLTTTSETLPSQRTPKWTSARRPGWFSGSVAGSLAATSSMKR